MLINASARYELLSANQQLIDFHLNRVIKAQAKKFARQQSQNEVENQQHLANDSRQRHDIKNAVIGEVSETEEMQGQSCTKPTLKGVTAGNDWSEKK